jgi:hypothetical protein
MQSRAASSMPLIGRIAHRLADADLKPGHEGSVEFKGLTTFGFKVAPDHLRVAIRPCYGRLTIDLTAVPVKRCHFNVPRMVRADPAAL